MIIGLLDEFLKSKAEKRKQTPEYQEKIKEIKCTILTKKGSRCKKNKFEPFAYCKLHLRSNPKLLPVYTFSDLNNKSIERLLELGNDLSLILTSLNNVDKDFEKKMKPTYGDVSNLYGDVSDLKGSEEEYEEIVNEYQNFIISLGTEYELMGISRVGILTHILSWEDNVIDSILSNIFEKLDYDSAKTMRKRVEESIRYV